MRRTLTALIALAFIFSCTAAWSAGKITEDPNAPGARIEADQDSEDAPKTDSRLAQKVTMNIRGKSTAVVLAQLSTLTGVTLYAGYNDSDWQVRDRKMNVFADDVPLAYLMSSIARVMKFKWSIRGEPDAYTYRLYMDRKTLLSAEAQRAREEQRLEEERAQRRRQALEDYARTDDLSPEELAKLKVENPFLYTVEQSGLRSSLGAFFNGAPSALDALTNYQELTMDASRLPVSAQHGLAQAIGDMNNFMNRLSGREPSTSPTITDQLDQVKIHINPGREYMPSDFASGFLLGMMRVDYPSGEPGSSRHIDFPLVDPNSATAKLTGQIAVDVFDSGRSIEEVVRDRASELQTIGMQAFMADARREEIGEPLIEHPEDEELERKIELKVDEERLDLVQSALAEATGFAVISDSFGSARGFFAIPEGETEIRTILDAIAKGYTYNWDKHAGVIEFRDREWYRKRTLQIPDAWLDAWRNTLKTTGTLDLGDLAGIAALTPGQMEANFAPDDLLSRSGVQGSAMFAKDFLTIYGALNAAQQSALFSASGLSTASLSHEQRAIAVKQMSRRSPGFFGPNEQADVTLTGKRKPEGKAFSYSFTAKTSYGLEPIEWTITTPVRPEEPSTPSTK